MFVAQHMLFTEHIVKLVNIYGSSFFHTSSLNDVLCVFKHFVKNGSSKMSRTAEKLKESCSKRNCQLSFGREILDKRDAAQTP
jgi:hypothetical protein